MLDVALIAAVKRSPAYRAIRAHVTQVCPSDTWYEDELAFVVFDLQSSADAATQRAPWIPQVVFVLAATSGTLLAARVVEPGKTGEEAQINDLLKQAEP